MATSRAYLDLLDSIEPGQDAPFHRSEYADRLERIRTAMQADGIDCLFLSSPESINYVSGYACEWYQANSPTEWLPASGIAVHVNSDRFVHFEHVQEATLIRLTAISDDVRLTEAEGFHQQDFVVDELRGLGWLSGTVGLELGSYRPMRSASEGFQSRLESGGATVVDGTHIVRSVRRYKSPAELACVREAQRIAEMGMQAASQTIRAGVTELEVYGEVIRAMSVAGGEVTGIPCPVVSGPRAGTVHGLASRRIIRPGEIVNVDLCGVYNRYHANMARCYSIGEPHPDVADTIGKVYGAFDVVESTLQPGLEVAALLDALEHYYKSEGILGDEWWVGGYELGIAFPPDWVGGFIYSLGEDAGDAQFLAGESLNFEANFYLPRAAGIALAIGTFIIEPEHAGFIHAQPPVLTVATA